MFKITGSEKAVLAAVIAGLSTFTVQIAQSGVMTGKEGIYSVITAILTHLTVYTATNTPKV